MERSTRLTASPETTHTYRFGSLTRAIAGSAATLYGAAGLFVAAKAFSENPAIGLITGTVVSLTAAVILYLFLYPRLSVGNSCIISRGPFATRTLFVPDIQGVALTYSKNGRIINLMPKDRACTPLRIHPYFATDRFFHDWLSDLPLLR